MAEILEARVWQKVDTLDNWNNNPLTLGKGEMALVLDNQNKPLSMKWGNGVDKFSDLPYVNTISPNKFTRVQFIDLINSSLLVPGISYIISGTSAGDIVCFSTSNNTISKNVIIKGDSFDTIEYDIISNVFQCYDNIGCVIRCFEDGIWRFIDDSDHTQKGFGSISQTLYEAVINYQRQDYTEVVSLVACPDETYVNWNVSMGASVGVQSSFISFQMPNIYGYIFWDGSKFDFLQDEFSLGMHSIEYNSLTGEIIINHSSCSTYGVNIECRDSRYRTIVNSVGSTSCSFFVVVNDGSIVTTPDLGMRFFFSKIGPKKIESAQMNFVGSNVWIQGIMKKTIS